MSSLDVIEANHVVFRQAVRYTQVDRWTHLGHRDLAGEVAEPVVRFMQDAFDFRQCVIFDTEGMERQVEPIDCIGLERAAAWDMHHIEERLLDYFLGRPNELEVSARVRLE